MVRRARVLAELEAEADLPYEQTRLARQAIPARRRIVGLLLLATLAALVEAGAQRSGGWLLGAVALGLVAWGTYRGSLAGLVFGTLAALISILLPLRLAFVGPHDAPTWIAMAVFGILGAAMLPDLVTLIRDAELQNTYGRWAKRA